MLSREMKRFMYSFYHCFVISLVINEITFKWYLDMYIRHCRLQKIILKMAADNFNRVPYYENLTLQYHDGISIDVAVDRNMAAAIRAGDAKDFISRARKHYEEANLITKNGNGQGRNDTTLVKRAKTMQSEIRDFLQRYKHSKSLPKVGDRISTCTSYLDKSRGISDEERDELTSFLCTFGEINLSKQDIPSMIHNTISFIIQHAEAEDKVQPLKDTTPAHDQPQEEKGTGKAQPQEERGTGWIHSDVIALIEAYRNRREEMANPTIKKIEVWGRVSKDLEALGIQKIASSCEKKWNNLKIRYRSIKDHNNKTGQETCTWAYFQEMDDILRKEPATKPARTISSTQQPEASSSTSKSERPKSPKAKRPKVNTDQPPTWMAEFIKEQREESTKRRNDFQEFRTEFLTIQKEKNEILKSLISSLKN